MHFSFSNFPRKNSLYVCLLRCENLLFLIKHADELISLGFGLTITNNRGILSGSMRSFVDMKTETLQNINIYS